MSFLLKRELPVERELRRVILHQLSGIVENLQQATGDAEATAIHDARRHVKKTRAALRLARASLGREYAVVRRRLRRANRMLGPIADARAGLDTLDRVQAFAGLRLPPTIVSGLRRDLLERATRIERQVEFTRLRDRIVRLLDAERRRVEDWTLETDGPKIVAGVARVHRGARSAMLNAFAHPTIKTYHAWRRAVKNEWYLVRLIADRCAGQLDADQRRLESLDGCLGDLHNVGKLYDLIASDSPLSRSETAVCLVALRAYRSELRFQAHEMGRIYHERSGRFAHRLRAAWDSPPSVGERAPTRPWPLVA